MRKYLYYILISCLILISSNCHAQFGGGNSFGNMSGNMGTTTVSNDTTSVKAAPMFSFKRYFRALGHKDTIPVAQMWAGSIILPGTAQIYNKDYWKLPVIYGGIAGMIYGGWYNNNQFQKTDNPRYANQRDWFYAGAALFYWASMLDGVIFYKTKVETLPGKATIYSALLPGLGQAYIGDYWRIPIYYAGLATAGYFWWYNNTKYVHYRKLYNQASDPNGNYTGPISQSSLKYYKDTYRRYRDYSVLATVLVYALQIVDANVFATLKDFEVNEDIAIKASPAVISPITTGNPNLYTMNAPISYGIRLDFTF